LKNPEEMRQQMNGKGTVTHSAGPQGPFFSPVIPSLDLSPSSFCFSLKQLLLMTISSLHFDPTLGHSVLKLVCCAKKLKTLEKFTLQMASLTQPTSF
jgi:hypothetical protein